MRYKPATEQGKFVLFWEQSSILKLLRKEFDYEGRTLKYSEQAFMIEKAKLFEPAKIEVSLMLKSGGSQHLGRKIQNFDDKVWNEKTI